MSHQQLFEPVLTGEPPARDTLDTLVRRSRRRMRYRRLTTAGTGLVVAGTLGTLLLPSGPPTMIGAPPSPAPSVPGRPSGALLGVEPAEPLESAVARLRDVVHAVVPAAAPGAQVTGRPTVERKVVPIAVGSLDVTYGYVITADVTAHGVTGTLRVTMVRQQANIVYGGCLTASPDVTASSVRYECVIAPDVAPTYTIETHVAEQPGMIRYEADADRADGSTVEVSISNEPALTGNPPLTGEQAAEIARDPRLTLYP
ncbi:hypothetical protein [Dactylosporangium sp. NPDC005555]|uniref:hypothetical protein n=1 Tax=Dactylosporangium sp. NPDC005555 TaxID=3154889 RepID=UPI0033BE7E7D